jgi:hypothetical protein
MHIHVRNGREGNKRMIRLHIKLLPAEASGLFALAQASLRAPREQARFLVREGLQRRGLLDDTHEADENRDDDTYPPEEA